MNERAAGQRAELEKRQKIEVLSIQFSQTQQKLGVFLEAAGDVLSDSINVSSAAEVQKLQSEYDKLVGQIPEQQSNYDSLVHLAQELQEAERETSLDDVTQRWTETLKGLDERKKKLVFAAHTQKQNDVLCKQFAEAAEAFRNWLQAQTKAAANASGDPDNQLQQLSSIVSALEGGKKELNKINDLSNKLVAAFITSNPYSDLNVKTLDNQYGSLLAGTKEREEQLQKDLISKKGGKVSADQIAEFKEMFQYFDRNHSGKLSKLEFKGVLQSVGEDPTDDEMEKLMQIVDTDRDGSITFADFTDYMVKRTADTDSADQILQSFKEIANDKEFITEADMRGVMAAAQVDYLIKNMPKFSSPEGATGYDYKSWVAQNFSHR